VMERLGPVLIGMTIDEVKISRMRPRVVKAAASPMTLVLAASHG
jgi:hypothetical protein